MEKEDDKTSGGYSLTYECTVCKQEYQHRLPYDYYSENDWHNFFDCCTPNCLEHEYDYDQFEKEFRHLTNYYDLFWKPWVISQSLKKNKTIMSPEELLNMHIGISYSLKLKDGLFKASLSVENAENIAWGKDIEYPTVKIYTSCN